MEAYHSGRLRPAAAPPRLPRHTRRALAEPRIIIAVAPAGAGWAARALLGPARHRLGGQRGAPDPISAPRATSYGTATLEVPGRIMSFRYQGRRDTCQRHLLWSLRTVRQASGGTQGKGRILLRAHACRTVKVSMYAPCLQILQVLPVPRTPEALPSTSPVRALALPVSNEDRCMSGGKRLGVHVAGTYA